MYEIMKWALNKILSGILLGIGFVLIAPIGFLFMEYFIDTYIDDIATLVELAVGEEDLYKHDNLISQFVNPTTMLATTGSMISNEGGVEFNVMVKNTSEKTASQFDVDVSLSLKGKLVRICKETYFNNLEPGSEINMIVKCIHVDPEIINEFTVKSFIPFVKFRAHELKPYNN